MYSMVRKDKSVEVFSSEIYRLLSSLFEKSVLQFGELGFLSQLLEELRGLMYSIGDAVFIFYSLITLILVYFGLRGPEVEKVLDLVEESEKRFRLLESSVYWSKVMLNVAEANILCGGGRVKRAMKIFEKLKFYLGLEPDEICLLQARIAFLLMMVSEDECRDYWQRLYISLKNNVKKCSINTLLIMIYMLGECLKMGGGIELRRLYKQFFKFLKEIFSSEENDLRLLYYSLFNLLVLNRKSVSPRELSNLVFSIANKDLGLHDSSSIKDATLVSLILADSIPYIFMWSAKIEKALLAKFAEYFSHLIYVLNPTKIMVDSIIIQMWENAGKEPDFTLLPKIVKVLGRRLRINYKRGYLSESFDPVAVSVEELIRNMDATGNLEALEELERRLWELPLSPEKIYLLATIIYTYAINGRTNIKNKFLETIKLTRKLVESKPEEPQPPKNNFHTELDQSRRNYARMYLIEKVQYIMTIFGKIMAVTKDPELIPPIIKDVCRLLGDPYQYLAFRYVLEGVVWHLKTLKHGIEFTAYTQYS